MYKGATEGVLQEFTHRNYSNKGPKSQKRPPNKSKKAIPDFKVDISSTNEGVS